MAKFRTLKAIHTGCNRRPRYLFPADVVIDLDPDDPKVKAWIDKGAIESVPEATPLTEGKVAKQKIRQLRLAHNR